MAQELAIVTGGAAGIGLAVTTRLAHFGDVVVADLDQAAVEAASQRGFDGQVIDVTSSSDWRRLAAYVRDRYGRLDTLVNNAGTAHIAALTDSTDEQIRRVLDTNVFSVLVGVRECWQLLRESHGNVVNIASVSALVGQDAAASYVASKGAVVSVTRALAVEGAPHGIRVNSVCPGSTMTDLLARHFASLPDGEEVRQRLEQRHPIGRLLTPDDIAPAIVQLSRPESAAITGTNVVVDGGLTATFDYGTSFAGGGNA